MATKKSTKTEPTAAAAPRKAPHLKLETHETLYDLTPQEVSAMSKPREGFEAFAEDILHLYETEQDELKVRGLDVAELRAHLASAASLAPVETAAAKYAEMVRETRLLHASRAWDSILEIYAKAQTASRTNQEIARRIADFTKFTR